MIDGEVQAEAEAFQAGEAEVSESHLMVVSAKPSDREMAADLKRRLDEALLAARDIAEEANHYEFQVALNWARDPFGRLTLTAKIVREY